MCVVALDSVAIARAKQRNVEQRERGKREQQRRQHLTGKRRSAWLHQNRLRMQRAEQVDAQVDERHEQRTEYAEYGAVSRAHRSVVDRSAKNDVRDVDEPEKQRER